MKPNDSSARAPIRVSATLLPLIALPLALDFKSGVQGGGLWQYLVTGLTFVAMALYLVANPTIRAKTPLWRFSTWAVALPIVGGLLTFAVNRVSYDLFIRVVIPLWLFAGGLLIGARAVVKGRAELLHRLLFIGCGMSVAFTLVAGFVVSGQSVEDIRYQINSAVLLTFEAMLLHRILIVQRHRYRFAALLVLCIAIQLLSVTRSAVLGLALLAVAALWLSTLGVRRFVRRSFLGAIASALVIVVALEATSFVNPALAHRWFERLNANQEHGADPTTLSRLAEATEQLRLWRQDAFTVLFGQGYGATYGWAESFRDSLLESGAFGNDVLDTQYFESGHNFWTSSLFNGGVLFGMALPLMIPMVLLLAERAYRRSRRSAWVLSRDAQLFTLSWMMLASFLATAIGGNPMGSRYASLVAGFALGMLLALDYRRRSQVSPEEYAASKRWRFRFARRT
jgi:hypothetical protein